ncbi:hypothetical protein [Priestia koreensis]|uniref:hypothetical protein n=1 Tax=Priestia koreensis TaxID=284581 RepID=UPI00345A5449
MKNDLEKQLIDFVKHTVNNVGDGYCLEINNEAKLTGVSNRMTPLASGLVIIHHNQNIYAKGLFEGTFIKKSTIEELNANDSILIGADCRDKKKYKILFKSGKTIGKITSKSALGLENFMLIFWESPSTTCLTICDYDPVRDENIREVVSTGDDRLKKFLRSIVRNFLKFSSDKSVDQKPISDESNDEDVIEDEREEDIYVPDWF